MTSAELYHYGLFAILALVTLFGAFRVAFARSIMHAAFWLFPVFAGTAGFYLFLNAQFLAAVQVLIYIGAILVLIVFAVTLTQNAMDPDESQTNRYVVPAILAAVVMVITLGGALLLNARWQPVPDLTAITVAPGVEVTEVSALGLVLLQHYLLPFEIASVLLLGAMIGAIVLARKERARQEQACACGTAACAAETEQREPAGVR